jgi:hypothetical protein
MSVRNRLKLEREIVIGACAVSAGIHVALAPEHFDESFGAGAGFSAAAVLLGGLVLALIWQPASIVATGVAGVVLAGLLASYALAATTGLPLLHPEPEPIDRFALATKAVEALGLIAVLHQLGQRRPAAAWRLIYMKGAQT